MIVPKTCYAKSGELSIAYQVVGEGPFDVVFVPGFNSNLDIGWQNVLGMANEPEKNEARHAWRGPRADARCAC